MLSFSKISIEKYNPEIPYQDQLCGLTLQFAEEISDEHGNFQFAKENKAKLKNFFCHDDLLVLFDKLRSHLAIVCEINTNQRKLDIDDPEGTAPGVHATGMVLTGSGEGEGLVIVGFKVLQTGQRLNLVTPNIDFEEYEFGSQLIDLVASIEREAEKAYNGRRKIIQGDLFEQDSDQGADGGTDDEINAAGDPEQEIVISSKALKTNDIRVTMTSMARTIEI